MSRNRKEFPTAVRVAVIKRATKEERVYCEKCGGLAKKFQIDHIDPDGLTGQPVLSNAQLLCENCYLEKNAKDTSDIAKAKRREAIDLGGKMPTANPVVSRGFHPAPPQRKASKPTSKPPANGLAEMARRFGLA